MKRFRFVTFVRTTQAHPVWVRFCVAGTKGSTKKPRGLENACIFFGEAKPPSSKISIQITYTTKKVGSRLLTKKIYVILWQTNESERVRLFALF